MENEKNIAQRIGSGVTALGLFVGGYAISKPDTAKACEPVPAPIGCVTCENYDFEECEPVVKKTKSKYGVTVDPETGIEYNTVVVEKGDNASKLSSRIVHYFIENKEVPKEDKEMYNEDYDTRSRFWPVVVYLNTEEGKKYSSKVGEKFIFPKTYEELVFLNGELKRSGWLANYVQTNGTYKSKKVYKVPKEKTRRYVEEIYREIYHNPCFVVDDAMLDAYLKAHSYEGKFVFDKHSKLDKKEKFILTEWIPTCQELDQYMPKKLKMKIR